MFEILKQPYPNNHNPLKDFLNSFFIGVFVFSFLFFFKPFGLHVAPTIMRLKITIGYGLVTFFITGLNYLFFSYRLKKWFNDKGWKVWKEIAITGWVLVCIGTGNMLFSYYGGFISMDLSFTNFLYIQLYTLAVGIFPIVFLVLSTQIRLNKRYTKGAEALNKSLKKHIEEEITNTITIADDEQKNSIEVNPTHLLYIAAADNYIEIYHLKDGVVKKEILRNTIKNIEQQNFSFLFRIHRSYIINLNNINSISGNSQGYKVHFDDESIEELPVARNRSKEFLAAINQSK